MNDFKYYKLLNKDNPIITGFLYGKFAEADRRGIQIDYQVELDGNIDNVPIHIMVEIIGILWDNSVESVKEEKEKYVKVLLKKHADDVKIEIANPIHDMSFDEISRLFDRGYSGKKNHSGIGLSKVKKYAEKYGFTVTADKQSIDGKYWLVICLDNYKSSHS